ncbi:MAG: riboflavin kinase, partial [Oscillospiraceae bacterium]|nr:riboflavin kinase [Oscillospiraceae bacterium]
NRFLGHAHVFTGVVQYGYRFGRTLGIPTVNMHLAEETVRLPNGVYATKSRTPDGKYYRSITYIGTRPSVSGRGSEVSVETHLDGFSGDLYGETIWIEFYDYIRGERKFDTHEELKAQIERDMETMRAFFDSARI